MKWDKVWVYLRTAVGILFFIWVFESFGYRGAYAVIIIITLMVIALVISKWDQFLFSCRYVESMIWGKPLEKAYWKKGEKLPKVKIVWRK